MAALTRHSHFLGHSSNVNCLRFGRKSGQVAATGGDDNMVNLWRMRERETKNIMSLSGHQSPVECLVFDPTERKLVAGSKAGSIKAFDLEAGKVSRTLKGHMSTCTTVDYHLYGDYVASGSLDTIVKVWDLRTKSCMQTFKGHKSEVTKVCFTPDGRWLTSGGMDGTIKIWDLTAGRMLREFPDHGGAITSLEFNPEEFILVSASTDKTIRIWDVQEFVLIGVTPTDSATTTAICHTVSDPHSGKYMISCSPDAVRVWSYETAIECHDSIACHKPKDVGIGEVQADITMLEDMKVMGGTIQDAFVSIWLLDLNQMRPFQQSSSKQQRAEPSHAPPAVVSPPPVVHPRVVAETSVSQSTVPLSARGRPTSGGVVRPANGGIHSRGEASQPQNGGGAARPVTPGVLLPQSLPLAAPTSTPPSQQGNPRINHVEDPRRSAPRKSESRPPSSNLPLSAREQADVDSMDNPQSIPGPDEQAPPQPIVTTDYIMELRCGMDTSVKTFRARQKCMQELLAHWEKGNLHDGLRFLAQLPNGKREAAVVDVLQTTDFQALGIDLEACVLLLPLVVELFSSKFEAYLNAAVEAGQRLFNAFSPVVKDSRDARQFQSRGVNLAGEERVQRCAACDTLFQDMLLLVLGLEQSTPYASLTTKIRALSRSMADFSR